MYTAVAPTRIESTTSWRRKVLVYARDGNVCLLLIGGSRRGDTGAGSTSGLEFQPGPRPTPPCRACQNPGQIAPKLHQIAQEVVRHPAYPAFPQKPPSRIRNPLEAEIEPCSTSGASTN
jgi:hypothetical protein